MKRTLYALFAAATVALTIGAAPAPFAGNESATGDYIRSNGSHMIINAIKHKNGTTTGAMWFQSTSGQIIIVAVNGLTVSGNTAYIRGIVTYANPNPSLVGFTSFHKVVDNGEGTNEPTDTASFFNDYAVPPADPTAALALNFPIREGNIQVSGN